MSYELIVSSVYCREAIPCTDGTAVLTGVYQNNMVFIRKDEPFKIEKLAIIISIERRGKELPPMDDGKVVVKFDGATIESLSIPHQPAPVKNPAARPTTVTLNRIQLVMEVGHLELPGAGLLHVVVTVGDKKMRDFGMRFLPDPAGATTEEAVPPGSGLPATDAATPPSAPTP